jgi:hypothetical protein
MLKIKDKKCKYCRNLFTPARPLQQVCSPKCAIGLENIRKDKAWKKRKKEGLEKLKKLSEYENDARDVFQAWVRERDKDLPCISCDRFAISYDGGHYFPADQFSGLIFHEDNVHKQCSRPCNKDRHGNQANYRIGLVKKIGLERVQWLEENKDRLRTYKYTKEELISIKNKYKQKLKELKTTQHG